MSYIPPSSNSLPYASPMTGSPNGRPTSVTVISILGIIFGSIGVLRGLFRIPQYLGFSNWSTNGAVAAMRASPGLRAYMIASLIIALVFAGVQFWAGVGMLKLKPAARKGMIYYACASAVLCVLGFVMNLLVVMPRTIAAMRTMRGMSAPNMQRFLRVSMNAGAFVGLIAIIWPILILYFLNRPNVKAAFGLHPELPPQSPRLG